MKGSYIWWGQDSKSKEKLKAYKPRRHHVHEERISSHMPICTFQRLRSRMFLFFFVDISSHMFLFPFPFAMFPKTYSPFIYAQNIHSCHTFTFKTHLYIHTSHLCSKPCWPCLRIKRLLFIIVFSFSLRFLFIAKRALDCTIFDFFIRNKMYNFFSSFYKKQSLIFLTLPLFIIKSLNKEFASLIILYHF